MKIKKVHVRMFRNILDSTPVEVQEDVTCLVGKNESGKTAFLQALWRLNPAVGAPAFSVPEQYPAWLEKRHRSEGKKLEELQPIEVHLALEAGDVKHVEAKFGAGVVAGGSVIKLWKKYDNNFVWDHTCFNERTAVQNFLAKNAVPAHMTGPYGSLLSFAGLEKQLGTDIAANAANAEPLAQLNKVLAAMKALVENKTFVDAAWNLARQRLPKFFYFAEYSKLPYTVKIQHILTTAEDQLDPGERTARALLRLGGAEQEYVLNADYERRKRELENVANALTDDVNTYWTQNKELRVQPDITQRTVATPQGQQAVLDELKLRIWDNRHSLSLPFTEHSAGFQWFFSFLAAFSEYEHRDPPVVILLDEPAVGLHARAQADFLRFIQERLAAKSQVLYTTHSPFMVEPGKLERVRLVEDRGKKEGSVVTSDVLTRDRDTLFPLQGALGYDLVQHLFVAENNLAVEGTSDYAYLKVVSDYLGSKSRTTLDAKWSIVPVGGADAIPTFVALLGNHLKITVVLDSRKEGHQRLERMAKDGYLDRQRIILVGDVLGQKFGDIEDLFEPSEYLALYNKAFNKSVQLPALTGTDAIVSRIARHEGVERFDHGRPADVFLRERDTILPRLSDTTLRRFEALFERINKTLGE